MTTPLHVRLTNFDDVEAAIRHVNDEVHSRGFDFLEDTAGMKLSMAWANIDEPDLLIVLASFDFSYYHNLELVFYGVSHSTIPAGHRWWDHWTKSQIELNPDGENGFEFRFNEGPDGDRQLIVRASGFSYLFGIVSYTQDRPRAQQ